MKKIILTAIFIAGGISSVFSQTTLFAPGSSVGNSLVSGKVGIGTNSPSYLLSVKNIHTFSVNPHGGGIDLHSTGNLSPHYQTSFNIYKGNIGYGQLQFTVDQNGNVGIGTTATTGFKLSVAGKMRAEEIEVSLSSGWADYVFADNYELNSLAEVEKYITENKHLPNVPSAKEVEEKGINLGEMDAILLRKIEELTLYTIELNKKLEALQKENETLKSTK